MNVEGQLIQHIHQLTGTAIDADTNLVDVIDSTGIMELVVWIEGTFGFTAELEDVHPDNFGSVSALSRWIAKNTPAA